jgi:hypothetical protein
MKGNTPWILTYMLLVAAFAYVIGWVSGEMVSRCKNAEEKVAELYEQLENACPATQEQQRQFRERVAQRPERRPQAHRRCLKSPQNPRPLNHAKSMAGSHRSGRSIRCGL